MNKKLQKNNKGITLIAFAIIIFIILAVAFTTIWFIFRKDSGEEVGVVQNNSSWTTEQQIEKLKEKGMDTRIVSNMTTDEVPIPDGFSYVQGTKKTGIIIKSNEYEIEYLFIPYNDTISDDVNAYYEKVEYISMDLMTLNSIKKYNGFFVELNSNFQMKDLKTINESNYEFLYEQLQYNIEDTVNSHILYKEEIAQINNFIASNNIDLGERTIGIQGFVIEPFSQVNPEELTTINENIGKEINIEKQVSPKIYKVSNLKLEKTATTKSTTQEYVYMYKTTSELYGGNKKSKVQIPIPNGFKYCEIDGVIMIQDTNNKNLIYIWVPTEYEDKKEIQSELWDKIYKNIKTDDGKTISKDTEIYKKIINSEENIDSPFQESIKKFNGFYISQAELSEKDEIGSENYMNISRGMVDYTVVNTANGGDYIRGSNIESKIYNNMKKIAKKSNKHESVVSHLMYGVEYDMAILWIANTNSNYIDKDGNEIYTVLGGNSTNVGKYSNSGLGAKSDASELKSFNGIWGLGGNLAELTQEKYNKNYVTRGGSYSDTGAHAPIASRNVVDDLNKPNIGLRTCLYINPDVTITTTESDTFKYNPKDDTIIKIDNIEFELWNKTPRYVNNWNGINVYERPSETSEVIKKINMAEEVSVIAKATNKVTKTDGGELTWARIDLDNNKVGYINANDLTDTTTYFGDSIGFVMTGEQVVRYYKDELTVYTYPNDEYVLFTTSYSGQIEIIGKSVDQKWALYKVGEENRFIHANSLSASIEKETAENGVELIKGKQKQFWTTESNVGMYSLPEENNTIKTLDYGTEVMVTAMSTDEKWSKVTIGSTQGFILTDKLTVIEPSEEQKAEKGGTFTPTNDVVYVTASSLKVRTSCDSDSDDNVVKSIPYRWGVDRIATGNNGWDKVNIDGNTCYMYNKYLSKTQPKAVSNGAQKTSTSNTSKTDDSGTDKTSDNGTDKTSDSGTSKTDGSKKKTTSGLTMSPYYLTFKVVRKSALMMDLVVQSELSKVGEIVSITAKGEGLTTDNLKFTTYNSGKYQYAVTSFYKKAGRKYVITAKTETGYTVQFDVKKEL